MGVSAFEDVLEKVDRLKVIGICRNLIKIPGIAGNEAEKAKYVASEMERLGLEVMEFLVEPGRPCYVGVLRGDGTGKSLMLCAHMETHPTTTPESERIAYTAKIEDGRIYGLGVGDNLAPMAAQFGAVDAIKKANVPLKGDVMLVATVDEKIYNQGARLLAENGISADMCIIGEPSGLDIGVASVGKVGLTIETKAYPPQVMHALAVQAGLKPPNAVISMAKVIQKLLEMSEKEPYFNVDHPLLGKGAIFNIGPIIGGSPGYGNPLRKPGLRKEELGTAQMIPQWCTLRVFARYWPGQTSEDFADIVKKWVEKAKEEDPSIDADVKTEELDYYQGNLPFELSPDEEVVQVLKKSIKYVLHKEPRLIGKAMTIEAPFYAKLGIPAAYCGPELTQELGGEHVTIQDLMNTSKIYTASILDICCGPEYKIPE